MLLGTATLSGWVFGKNYGLLTRLHQPIHHVGIGLIVDAQPLGHSDLILVGEGPKARHI
jgi:hypothetical protein